MSDELKPVNCGCGGEAKVMGALFPEGDPQKNARCECSNTTERTAKVETVEKPNVFKCSECGQYFHSTAWGSPVLYCSRCGARLIWNEDIPMEYFESGGR